MAKQTKTQVDELVRRVKNARLLEVDKANAADPRCKNNTIGSAAANWVHGVRVSDKINPDGERMGLKEEIAYRERTGYGKPETIAALKKKLNGDGANSLKGVSDAELLKQIEAA